VYWKTRSRSAGAGNCHTNKSGEAGAAALDWKQDAKRIRMTQKSLKSALDLFDDEKTLQEL